MLSDRTKIDAAKAYLRRKFIGDLPGLQAYSDEIFSSAVETVTITSGSFEGGSGTGQVTFERILLVTAVEELLREMNGAAAADRRAIFTDFSANFIRT